MLNVKFNISELHTLSCYEILYVFIDSSQLKPIVWFCSDVSVQQLHYLDLLLSKSIKSSCESHWDTIVIGRGMHHLIILVQISVPVPYSINSDI